MNTNIMYEMLGGRKEDSTKCDVNRTILDTKQVQNTGPQDNVDLHENVQECGDFKMPLKDSLIINRPRKAKRHHNCKISNISVTQDKHLQTGQRLLTDMCNVYNKSCSDHKEVGNHAPNSTPVHSYSCIYKNSFSCRTRTVPLKCDVIEKTSRKHLNCENCDAPLSHKYTPKIKKVRGELNSSNFDFYNNSFMFNSKPKRSPEQRPFTCKLCAKSFSFQTSFDKHMLVHSRKKPYSCLVCEKTYFHKEDLIYHLNIHINSK